jgi:hypothetical protein
VITAADRTFLRLLGAAFQRRLLPALGSVLLAVGLVDPMVEWNLARTQIAALPDGSVALMVVALVGSWCGLAGRALAPLWQSPAVGFALRQPITDRQWVRYLLPSLLPALLPIGAIWWLMPCDTLASLVGLIVSAWLLVLGTSYRAPDGLGWQLAGVAGCVVAGAGLPALSVLAWPAVLALMLLLPLSTRGLRRQRTRASRRAASGSLLAGSAMIAVLRRDLLCLWRLERGRLSQLAVLALVCAAFALALRVNGDFTGRSLFRAACILQLVALLPVFELLTRLQMRLGPELVRVWWPMTMLQRAVALVLLVLVICVPSTSLLVLGGAAMGPGYQSMLLLYTCASAVALCALLVASARNPAASFGWSLWVWLVHALLVIVLPPVAYVPLALLLMLAGMRWMCRGWRRVAVDAAHARLEER